MAVTWKMAFEPCMVVTFVGWLVMTGGVLEVTSVISELLLFAELGSAVTELMVTTFVTRPRVCGVTVTVTLLTLPTATLPTEQMTVPFVKMHPGEAEEKVTIVGRESVTIVLKAGSGPTFVTAIV